MAETTNESLKIVEGLGNKSLDIKNLTPDQIKKLGETLDKPEMLSQLKSVITPSLSQETTKKILSQPKLSDSDRLILDLLAKLYPTETLGAQLEKTIKPSDAVSKLVSGDQTTLDRLSKMSIEQIQEQFGTVSKGDLKAIIAKIDSIANMPAELNGKLKQVVGVVLNVMIESGFVIENQEDVAFLEKNGSENVKKIIAESKTNGALKDYKDTQLIMKKTGNEIKVEPIIKDGKLIPGVDISKLNSVDIKKSAETIKKSLPADFNMEKMRDTLKALRDSGFPGAKLLTQILGIFLGINLEGGGVEKREQSREKLNAKERKALLKDMTKNDRYEISTLFDNKGGFSGDKSDPKAQAYIKDVYTLLGKELPKDSKTLLEYSDELQKEVKVYEKSIDGKETGQLSGPRITEILGQLDDNGEPKKKAEGAPEARNERHQYADLFEALKGKGFLEIKRDQNLVRKIQGALGIPEDGQYGPKTIEAVKGLQRSIGAKADGLLGRDTVTKFYEKFPNGIIPKIEAPKK